MKKLLSLFFLLMFLFAPFSQIKSMNNWYNMVSFKVKSRKVGGIDHIGLEHFSSCEKGFKCEYCDHEFKNKKNMARHLDVHNVNKKKHRDQQNFGSLRKLKGNELLRLQKLIKSGLLKPTSQGLTNNNQEASNKFFAEVANLPSKRKRRKRRKRIQKDFFKGDDFSDEDEGYSD
ncbi:C2H2-type zinc finger protein, partial [Candidatus Dependentiae bacterium]